MNLPINPTPAPENDNAITLQGYQSKTKEYIENTPPVDGVLKTWIDDCLDLISQDGKIL